MPPFFFGLIPDGSSLDFAFISVELRTGLTFSKSALQSRYRTRRDRNQAQARRAYDALLYFLPKSSLTSAESDTIHSGIAQLKLELQELGEKL